MIITITKYAFNFKILKSDHNVSKDCPKIPKCQQEDYLINTDFKIRMGDYDTPSFNTLSLRYRTGLVEMVQSFNTYNGQSLVGDVGGSLSLFLGLCGLGILVSMASTILKNTNMAKILM